VRTRRWLRPGGRLLVHVFCHREYACALAPDGPADWTGRHVLTAGIMPADGLILRFQDRLRCVGHWRWNGRHCEAAANAWLANLDRSRQSLMAVPDETCGPDAERGCQRWRVFFTACAELFGFRGGQEWWVVHHLLEKPEHG